MEKYAWRAKIVSGKKEEYIKRHNEIWPEMKKVLKDAGICNYTIWYSNDEVFGYYECEFGLKHAADIQKESQVVQKWNEYMKDILIIEINKETGLQPEMKKVFELD